MSLSLDIADKTILHSHLAVPFTPSEGNFHSLPNPDPLSDPIIQVQRSFSLTLSSNSNNAHSPAYPQFGTSHGNWTQQRWPCTYSCLRHSNSAPVIGGQLHRRRLSLQSLHSYGNEEGRKLRRTSSEVYVDRGPDIDSPKCSFGNWEQDILIHKPTQRQREQGLFDISHAPSGDTHRQLSQRQETQQEHEHFDTSHVPSSDALRQPPQRQETQQEHGHFDTSHAPSSGTVASVEQSESSGQVPIVTVESILSQAPQRDHSSSVENSRHFPPSSVQVQGSPEGREVTRGMRGGVAEVGVVKNTEVERHVTQNGRTFETYKTVC